MQWLNRQPYVLPPQPLPAHFPLGSSLLTLADFFLAIPFLLLPIIALFLPNVRKSRPSVVAFLALILVGYLFLGIYPSHLRGGFPLEPTMGGGGNWIGVHGIHEGHQLHGNPPLFLNVPAQALITIVCFGGLLALLISLLHFYRLHGHQSLPPVPTTQELSWKQLAIVLVPFTLAYTVLLIPRTATGWIYDRYTLELGLVALICLVRYYQEQIQTRIPLLGIALVATMAVVGVAITHNHFSVYRARVALAAELHANGIPDTSIDNGFEQNFIVELQYADHINDKTIVFPTTAYVPSRSPACRHLQDVLARQDSPHHPDLRHLFRPQRLLWPGALRPRLLHTLARFQPGSALRRSLCSTSQTLMSAQPLLSI